MTQNQLNKPRKPRSSRKRPLLDEVETLIESMEAVQKKQDQVFEAAIVFSLMLAAVSIIGLLLVQKYG